MSSQLSYISIHLSMTIICIYTHTWQELHQWYSRCTGKTRKRNSLNNESHQPAMAYMDYMDIKSPITKTGCSPSPSQSDCDLMTLWPFGHVCAITSARRARQCRGIYFNSSVANTARERTSRFQMNSINMSAAWVYCW